MAKIHFLEVGCADTTLIESNGYTIMVDCYNIINFKHLLPSSKLIQAVFITHQHYDHFKGLEYLRDNDYKIEYIICSPYKRRYLDDSVKYDEWNLHNSLINHFESNGSKVDYPYRQGNFDLPWKTIAGLDVWMIGPEQTIADKDTRELHDASLVFVLKGLRKCCFTGDASDLSLNFICGTTKNYCGDILHASHHGSIKGAEESFIKKSDPAITVISTEEGVHENVPDPAALKRYATYTRLKVYRTDIDKSIHWDF